MSVSSTGPSVAGSSSPVVSIPDRPSPGALLRQARERAGLSIEELAEQTKLAKNTLELLEQDDFSALSEPVYVRGYYRKIAKVLPVVAAELIEGYVARGAPPRASAVPPRIPLAGGVDSGTSRRHRGQSLGWIAVIVVALSVLVFLTDENSPLRLPESRRIAADVRSGVSSLNVNSMPAAAGTKPVSEPDNTDIPASSTIENPPAVPVQNQLVLEFMEAAFVRVEDARGRALVVGLVRGGERKLLEGQPPYAVLLGNARNVKVFFNAQPVDFSPHINIQNSTARFTVPSP
ncbi:MAG: DUF4115 domain-containing protein [Nevskiales bacterium]|nr:DUF4115 domain-containing protein [Nevskiales bacterium]